MTQTAEKRNVDYVPIVIFLGMLVVVAIFASPPSPFAAIRRESLEGFGILPLVVSIVQGFIPASLIGLVAAFSAERQKFGIFLVALAILSLLASTAGLLYLSPLPP